MGIRMGLFKTRHGWVRLVSAVTRLGSNQPVYGLSVHFAEKRPLVENTVEALASLYIQDLLPIQAQGPFQLAGVSFGGMIALEMARQLNSKGITIDVLALLDTLAPGALKSIAGTERASAHWQALHQQGIAYVFGKILARMNRIQGPLKELRLRSQFGLIQLLSRLKRQLSPEQKDFMARYENRMASRNHVPKKYDQDVLLFKCTDWDIGVSCELDPSLGWGEYVQGKLTVHEIPGDHLGMLSEPNVQVLAEFLNGYLIQQGRTA